MKSFFILALICPLLTMCQPLSIHGTVLSESGEPVAGATVSLRRTSSTLSTNAAGEFSFTNTRITDSVTVSAIGYETTMVGTNERGLLTITLRRKIGLLDEAIIIAYGTTTRKLSTSSTGQVTAAQIARQPVFDPLSALQGHVPGLLVSPTSGVPGSAQKLQIRGRGSIANGSDPLIIIDGIPFAPNNSPVSQYPSLAGGFPDVTTGLSPLSGLNPADIESIDVLKDADATAIYGSRGAGGVILITTKKGKSGKTNITASFYQGWSGITRTMPLLATTDYLRLRREAFANDGVPPTAATAPDLLVWDTARSTDFTRQFLGGQAPSSDAELSVSGGSGQTQFTLGGGYHREGTVLPGELTAARGSVHLGLQHSTVDRRFSLEASATYSSATNHIIVSDLSSYTSLPPDYPSFFQSDGSLNWQEGGVPISNPFAYLAQTYQSMTNNLLGNLTLSFRPLAGLTVKMSGGYNTYLVSETTALPKASLNPYTAAVPLGSSQSGSNSFTGWILEPQLTYTKKVSKGQFSALLGATFQQTDNRSSSVAATGFTNDALLFSFGAAAATSATNNFTLYHYEALFGRLTYNWQARYILNVSGRRDGSSRFGPARQFAGFGAVGGAWIVSNERWFRAVKIISYLKLRGSAGTTGNDQIGAYQYLDTWTGSTRPYGGAPSLYPNRLYNPDYGWEKNTKWDGALEIGLFDDRLVLSVDYFKNTSSNQLIRYTLPAITGFTSVLKNFPATVQNKGWEGSLTLKAITRPGLRWSMTATLTGYRNQLAAFPGLETSSYASTYAVGQSLSIKRGYHLLGVDPATGLYVFDDLNKDGVLDGRDYTSIGNTDPNFYGGLENTVTLGPWTLSLFLEGKKQQGLSWAAGAIVPGTSYNLPTAVADHWRVAGDASRFQKLTATPGTPAYKAAATYSLSDGIYTDASYIRVKNLSVSYALPIAVLQKLHIQKAVFFFQGQNLAMLTGYDGADPEVQNLNILPPLRTLTAGISLTF